MPRPRRRSTGYPENVPQELCDASAAVWGDAHLFADWLDFHGLREAPDEIGPAQRRKWAIERWAHENGCASESWPALLDWHKLNEMFSDSIRHYWSDATRERLARYVRD